VRDRRGGRVQASKGGTEFLGKLGSTWKRLPVIPIATDR
jgi:hypothetical protein